LEIEKRDGLKRRGEAYIGLDGTFPLEHVIFLGFNRDALHIEGINRRYDGERWAIQELACSRCPRVPARDND
jgi:hypothetical protein